MKEVTYALYWLPPRNPRAKPYRSAWKMNAAEAAALGAIERVEASVEVREIPETDAEQLHAKMHYQSAGHDGVKPPGEA